MFDQVAAAMYSSQVTAIGAAFIWGIFSVIFSPCHLSAIPLVIAYINKQQSSTAQKDILISLCFAAGIMITLVVVSAVFAAAGLLLSSADQVLSILISIILFAGGLYFLGVLPESKGMQLLDLQINDHPYRNALILGLAIGLGLGACAMAFMAPVISLSLAGIKDAPVFAVGLLSAFIIGHCLVIAISGLFVGKVKRLLMWKFNNSSTKVIKIISGILLLIAGIYNLLK